MSKYNNYIFLTICETSIKCFEKTNFLTYINYAKNMGLSLNTNTLTNNQFADIGMIVNDLEKIYNLDNDMISKVISEYFNSDKILLFEKYVRKQKIIFPEIK